MFSFWLLLLFLGAVCLFGDGDGARGRPVAKQRRRAAPKRVAARAAAELDAAVCFGLEHRHAHLWCGGGPPQRLRGFRWGNSPIGFTVEASSKGGGRARHLGSGLSDHHFLSIALGGALTTTVGPLLLAAGRSRLRAAASATACSSTASHSAAAASSPLLALSPLVVVGGVCGGRRTMTLLAWAAATRVSAAGVVGFPLRVIT